MPRSDVIIAGAGILGCMIAREVVSRAPRASVVLIDRDLVGSGTSRRSAGLSVPLAATGRLRRMAAYSRDYYDKLKRACPALPVYPLSLAVVAPTASEAAVLSTYLATAALSRAPGAAGGMVRIPEHMQVWAGAGCHYADVYAVVQMLARKLRSTLSLREGVSVTEVEPAGSGVAVRLGTGETLTAGQVVLAPGAWLHVPAWRDLIAPLGLGVKRIVCLHVEQEPASTDPVIVFSDEDNAFLLPVRHRGHWLFSYTCHEWDVDPDAPPAGMSARTLAEARAILDRYAPVLAARCGGGRICCDAYSPTREPVLRALDEHGRVIFAGAANGSGYRLAPAIAAAAVSLLEL